GSYATDVTLSTGELHTLTATQTSGGQTSDRSPATTVIVRPPPPTLSPPAPTQETSFDVTGTAFPGASVEIWEENNGTRGAGIADGAGNYGVTVALTVGVHVLTALQWVGKAFSEASAPVTATVNLSPPGAPSNVAAVGGNGQATVTFSPPSSDGGAP